MDVDFYLSDKREGFGIVIPRGINPNKAPTTDEAQRALAALSPLVFLRTTLLSTVAGTEQLEINLRDQITSGGFGIIRQSIAISER